MSVGDSFVFFRIFYFILAYGIQNTTSSSKENSLSQLFDAPAGTTIGRVTIEDVSDYSSIFLTGMKTQVSVKVGEDMIYRLELAEPSAEDKRSSKDDEASPEDEKMNNDDTDTIEETPELKASAVKELADQLKADADYSKLYTPTHNDAWLIRFLRARNYDVKQTTELIKRYYRFKEENSYIYDGLIPSEAKKAFATGLLTVLARRDRFGSRILIARGATWDGDRSSEFTLNICRMTVALLEIGVYEPATQLNGIQFILDLADMGFDKFKAIGIAVIRKMLHWIKRSVPLKLKGIHIVNKPSWFWLAQKTVLNLIIGDIKDIFHVHNDLNSLHKKIQKSSLPDTYGGEYPMFNITEDEWEVFLKHQDEEYNTLCSYGFNKDSNKTQKKRKLINSRQHALPAGKIETSASQSVFRNKGMRMDAASFPYN